MRYNGRHMSPPQILGTHESDSTPNGISIGSAVFAQLSRVSNTSVAIGRIQGTACTRWGQKITQDAQRDQLCRPDVA